ncbi:hypothetical protein CK203_000982 [Vitis vinifera]|uniref:Uncharacterized protein n=1 Tax=Vitis vinifera TaxID=29760 RepID=A0A438KLE9_VITVI|nr:hypothetical protein CK203_000982 [Vitis vinifera]
MDEMQNDMAQKLDILQDSISRLANLNTVQEKENSPSQPYQNSMSIHEVEAQEGESSMVKEVAEVITLRSGKEVDLPTCKLEHKVESETEKEKREEIKGKKKGKSIEKDDYDVNVQREPLRIVIKEELMKKYMPPSFPQGKIIQTQWPPFRSCEPPKHEILHFAGKLHLEEDFAAAKPFLAHECHFAAHEHPFRSCETHCEVVKPDFAPKVPFRRVFRNCEADFGTRVPFRSTVTLISQLRNGCEVPKREKSQFHSRTPISAIVGHISITSRSSNYACNISFESLGSHESTASNGARFGFETEMLWPFEDDCANHERKCRTSIFLLQESSASNGMQFGGEMKKLWSFEDKRAKLSENSQPRRHLEGCLATAKPISGTQVPFAA